MKTEPWRLGFVADAECICPLEFVGIFQRIESFSEKILSCSFNNFPCKIDTLGGDGGGM